MNAYYDDKFTPTKHLTPPPTAAAASPQRLTPKRRHPCCTRRVGPVDGPPQPIWPIVGPPKLAPEGAQMGSNLAVRILGGGGPVMICVPPRDTYHTRTLHGEYVFTYSYSVATGIRVVYSAWIPLCWIETCTYSSNMCTQNRLSINRILYSFLRFAYSPCRTRNSAGTAPSGTRPPAQPPPPPYRSQLAALSSHA